MKIFAVVIAVAVVWHASEVRAEGYPDHVVRIVVPNAAGGGYDSTARVLADKLGPALGQRIYVENRTGAGTIVGTEAVAQAPADGYTLLLGGLSSMAFNPGLYKKLPFDPLADFVPIDIVANWSFTLVARKDLPQNTLQEVIAYAKANPDKMTYASGGAGTGQHIAMAVTASEAGVKMIHVPFRGAAAAYQDVLGGRIDLFFDNTGTAQPQVDAKSVKVLAVSSAQRQRTLPDVPTVMETGVAPLDQSIWFGLFVRRGTPEPIIERLRAATKTVMQDPSVRKAFEQTGGNIMDLSAQEASDLVKRDVERWTKILHDANISAD
jgi:tripartite-type tricarboxylate transporter receptor subunit TctC